MADVILHHYAPSPVAQKIRALLGYKRIPWRSVVTPAVMPKPDLVALTGGYRKAPVLQIGADVYCDSKLISRVLERRYPDPVVIPPNQVLTCTVYEQWAEKLFMLTIPVVFQPKGVQFLFGEQWEAVLQQFSQDRAALFTGGTQAFPSPEMTEAELPALLQRFEAQLAQQEFLLGGNTPSLADFSLYFPVWFIHCNGGVANYLSPYPRIQRWCARLTEFETRPTEELSGEAALTIARTATPLVPAGELRGLQGLQLGAQVAVAATDYGVDPVHGTLVHADEEEVAVRRRDERAGEVIVHFPRTGFRVTAA